MPSSPAPRVLVIDHERDAREALAADLGRRALSSSSASLETAATTAVRLRPRVVIARASDTWTTPAPFASLREALPGCALIVVAHLFDVARALEDAAVVLTLPCSPTVVAAAVRLAAMHTSHPTGARSGLLLVAGPPADDMATWLARVGAFAANVVVAHSTLRAAIALDTLVVEGRAPRVVVHPTADGESLRRAAARHRARLDVVP